MSCFGLTDLIIVWFCCYVRFCQTNPIWFWLSVSGFGQIDPAWKQAAVQESSGPLLANTSEPIWIGCESDPTCLKGTRWTSGLVTPSAASLSLSLVGAASSIIFVATKVLSQQTHVFRDKRQVLSRQAYFCRDKRRVLSRQK